MTQGPGAPVFARSPENAAFAFAGVHLVDGW